MSARRRTLKNTLVRSGEDASGREGGAGGLCLDELNASDGGGGEVLEEEEACMRGADGEEVCRRAAGVHQAEEGVMAAGRGLVQEEAPRQVHQSLLASLAPKPRAANV